MISPRPGLRCAISLLTAFARRKREGRKMYGDLRELLKNIAAHYLIAESALRRKARAKGDIQSAEVCRENEREASRLLKHLENDW